MRSESRPHPTHLWTDPRVQALPLSLKRLLDYCWTGPDVNGAGVSGVEPGVWQSRIGEIGAAVETGLELLEKAGFIAFDKKTLEVFVLDWFRFHKFNGKVAMAAYAKGLRETRSDVLRKTAAERYALSVKTTKSVDNSTRFPKKQALNPSTATSTSTVVDADASGSAALETRFAELLTAASRVSGSDRGRDLVALLDARDSIKRHKLSDDDALEALADVRYPSQARSALESYGQSRQAQAAAQDFERRKAAAVAAVQARAAGR